MDAVGFMHSHCVENKYQPKEGHQEQVDSIDHENSLSGIPAHPGHPAPFHWTLLFTQVFLHHYLRAWARPCRRDIKKNRVTLALSPKGVSQHLAFQIPARFTSSSESTKNEISDSPSRKTAISQCDESSFFVFCFFLFLCFFLFCFQWDFLSIIFLPKQK